MELDHFSHRHPLLLKENPNDADEEAGCFGCQRQVFSASPAYSCTPCNFFLHKSCAELPNEMNHALHPKHPLTLTANSSPAREFKDCKECFKPIWSFTYCCSLCEFYLHITCASLPHSVKHSGHKHPLTLLLKPATFDCNACGTEGEGISYLCITCQFWIHPNCSLLPTSMARNNRLHKHPLVLAYSLRVDNSRDMVIYCEICGKKVNPKYWLYHCAECSFFSHVGCSTSEKLQSWGLRSLSIMPKLEELCTDLIARYVKKTGVGEDERSTKFKHFSHEHCLMLSGDDDDDKVIMMKKDDDDKCDACIQPISAPVYSCDDRDCNFFIHESCAKLPRKMRHPLHAHHQLTLLAKACLDGVFRCSACNFLCNGFAYSCLECNFYLDIKCSVVPRSIRHESQNFKFFLDLINLGDCIACGLGEAEFKSVRYELFLHFRCAMLPWMVRHRFHKHPLILRYSPIEDEVEDPNQCICDICEELRNLEHWFYYCADCNFTAHLDCARDPFKYIKFGGTQKCEAHPHILTLVKQTRKNHDDPCDKCGEPCKTMALECADCKFNIHWNCDAKMLSSYFSNL